MIRKSQTNVRLGMFNTWKTDLDPDSKEFERELYKQIRHAEKRDRFVEGFCLGFVIALCFAAMTYTMRSEAAESDVWRAHHIDQAVRFSKTYREYQNREDTRHLPSVRTQIAKLCLSKAERGMELSDTCKSYLPREKYAPERDE